MATVQPPDLLTQDLLQELHELSGAIGRPAARGSGFDSVDWCLGRCLLSVRGMGDAKPQWRADRCGLEEASHQAATERVGRHWLKYGLRLAGIGFGGWCAAACWYNDRVAMCRPQMLRPYARSC